METDVIIIGAGVIGCAVARELSKYKANILVLEKEEDVCEGTSKANSGIVHAGFDAKENTLKAKLNVEGSRMMFELAEDLEFDIEKNGSLVLCFEEAQKNQIEDLYQRGIHNGVKNLAILNKEEVLKLEPGISEDIVCALHAPDAGIVCPFSLTYALAENAADNGVKFIFNTKAESIEKTNEGWLVNHKYKAKALINAAGVYGDEISNLHEPSNFSITPRKGEYFLLDKEAGSLCSHTLFQLPGPLGKGILITPTVHGNLLVGPTALDQEDKEDVSVGQQGMDKIKAQAGHILKDVPFYKTITSFSGLRAHGNTGDFVIDEGKDGFFNVIGIESPGLSSAPAIGKMVADFCRDYLDLEKKDHFISKRKKIQRTNIKNPQTWNEMIEQNKDYGEIICRCETITKGEIVDALTRSVPAVSIDGIKRRVRAGMGRCQGGFCMPKVMEIIAEVQNQKFEDIQKSNENSKIITGKPKEVYDEN